MVTVVSVVKTKASDDQVSCDLLCINESPNISLAIIVKLESCFCNNFLFTVTYRIFLACVDTFEHVMSA